jgi:hypothetical protein
VLRDTSACGLSNHGEPVMCIISLSEQAKIKQSRHMRTGPAIKATGRARTPLRAGSGHGLTGRLTFPKTAYRRTNLQNSAL